MAKLLTPLTESITRKRANGRCEWEENVSRWKFDDIRRCEDIDLLQCIKVPATKDKYNFGIKLLCRKHFEYIKQLMQDFQKHKKIEKSEEQTEMFD